MRPRFLVLPALVFSLASAARAESFTLYNLGTDAVNVLGIDAGGSVLLQTFSGCSVNDPNFCYEEFTNGVMTYHADVAPSSFVFDNGTNCAAPAGASAAGKSVCNGGYQVFGATDPNQVMEITPSSATLGDIMYQGTADRLFVNGSGDFVAVNGAQDSVYQVLVSQTPEPGTLALLGTGLLGIVGLARKRLF